MTGRPQRLEHVDISIFPHKDLHDRNVSFVKGSNERQVRTYRSFLVGAKPATRILVLSRRFLSQVSARTYGQG